MVKLSNRRWTVLYNLMAYKVDWPAWFIQKSFSLNAIKSFRGRNAAVEVGESIQHESADTRYKLPVCECHPPRCALARPWKPIHLSGRENGLGKFQILKIHYTERTGDLAYKSTCIQFGQLNRCVTMKIHFHRELICSTARTPIGRRVCWANAAASAWLHRRYVTAVLRRGTHQAPNVNLVCVCV